MGDADESSRARVSRMAPPDPAVELSVGVVTYNRAPMLDQCLRSLRTACVAISYEVIVVDNSSRDGTVRMLGDRHPDVRVVANAENPGLTRAGNQAISLARGRHFLFLNDDTEIPQAALEELMRFQRAHPEAGAVGPQLLYADGTEQGAHKAFPTPLAAFFGRRSLLRRWFPNNRFSRRYLTSAYARPTGPYEVDSVSSACILIRRETIDDVGGMDEGFFVYWSDVDWCRRMKDRGWKLYVVPSARVVHLEGQMISKQRPRAIIDFHRGAYRYYCKHDVPSALSPMRGAAFVGLGVRTLVMLVANALRPSPPHVSRPG